MKKLNLIFNNIIFFIFFTQLQGQENFISGTAKVIDGDSIKISNHRIRLLGIDAPELKQLCKDQNNKTYACGKASKIFLKSFIEEVKKLRNLSEVFCYYSELDKYKRVLGECFVGSKRKYSLNQAMVMSGNAIAYLRYSDKYLKDQEAAMKRKRDLVR